MSIKCVKCGREDTTYSKLEGGYGCAHCERQALIDPGPAEESVSVEVATSYLKLQVNKAANAGLFGGDQLSQENIEKLLNEEEFGGEVGR